MFAAIEPFGIKGRGPSGNVTANLVCVSITYDSLRPELVPGFLNFFLSLSQPAGFCFSTPYNAPMTQPPPVASQQTPPLRVIRSARRKKTAQARLEQGVLVLRIPASLSKAEEERITREMVAKVQAKMNKTVVSDADLQARAKQLNRRYLQSRASVRSIRWVTNQHSQWGSCTALTGDIRISHHLKRVPQYVLDAVIIHELVHTFIHDGHSDAFWQWANKAPKAERAKGYLEAYQHWGKIE